MSQTYQAMQVTTPGTLELVDRPVPAPGRDQVLISVEACGICSAGASDIKVVAIHRGDDIRAKAPNPQDPHPNNAV